MSKWMPFKKHRDAFMEGFKASRDTRERKQKAKEDERKQAVQRISERLEKFAASIVVKHRLRQSTEAPMFLRLFLRRKVLEKEKRTRKENDGMVLADKACYLQTIILKNRYSRVSLEEGQAVYKSIATIMSIAGPLLKETKGYQTFDFKRAQSHAKENFDEITKRAGGQILINRLKLMETTQIGNAAISELAKDMPEHTQIAFDAVEEVIERMS